MDLVRQLKSRSTLYATIGRLLLSAGVILGCTLFIHMARVAIDNKIGQQVDYLVIVSSPAIGLPPATPLPTITPTPSPTAPPPALPATRLFIPAISLNSTIKETSPIISTSDDGEEVATWETAAFAIGHFDTSGNPGGGRNIVLSGHNNTLGEVFRHLDKLNIGDEIILFTQESEFHYIIQKKYIIPFWGDEKNGNLQLQSFSAPQATEMVTLISCWPYATNANRIIIIAIPVNNPE
jgi:LPXTG-site transpeptidase (sortase) family protein